MGGDARMIPVTSDIAQVLASSHAAAPVRLEAWMGATRRLGSFEVSSGSVSQDATQFTRRSASFTVASTPQAREWLRTPGVGIRLWEGALVNGSARHAPTHWGVVYAHDMVWESGTITFTSNDMLTRVTRGRFLSPRSSTPGMTVPLQAAQLIHEVIPWSRTVNEAHVAPAVPSVTWEQDRDAAVSDLVRSAGLEAFWRPTGEVVIRPLRTQSSPADMLVRSFVNLATATESVNAESVANVVVARSDSGDGAGYWGVSIDDDPRSATRVDRATVLAGGAGGEFFNPKFYASSLFTSDAQCEEAARSQRLLASRATRTVAITCPRNLTLEAGDRVDVRYGADRLTGIAQSVSYDIFSPSMSVTVASAQPSSTGTDGGLS